MAFAYKPPHSKTWRIGFRNRTTGKLTSISANTTKEAEARKKAKDLSAEQRLKISRANLVTPGDHKFRLSEAFDFYLSQKIFAPKTLKAYQNALAHFYSVAGDQQLYRYSKFDYFKLVTLFKQKQFKQNTQSNYTRHLFTLFKWLQGKKLIEENFIEKINEEKKEPEIVPEQDLRNIFNYLKKLPDKQYYNIIFTKYLGAYRISEVVTAEVSDFDFQNEVVYIRNQKENRVDKIPMSEDFKEHLESIRFPKSGKAFRLRYEGLKSFWQRLMLKLVENDEMDKASLEYKYKIKKHYPIHQLRRTRGTNLANLGVAPTFLHKYMRHKNFQTSLKYYIKIDIDSAREDINNKLRNSNKDDTEEDE